MTARARSIVVGYDGSEVADRALDAAADLVGYGSLLTVLTLQADQAPPGPGGRTARDAERASDRARAHLQCRHVQARYVASTGDPADDIVATATDLRADLVVVGRQNGAPTSSALDTTSADVVRRAPCDVLVVR
jgi:nucleotide-binding universal stress UspA family protein